LIECRLDILIYAHDGRGLGHASRSIGIGMALRRLYPDLKVLFVSGCRQSQELIGFAPLDWLKLPAYETQVKGGRSRGITGKSMFTDRQLGEFRAKELKHLVTMYRPRLVLADHTPQGKHKELIPALSINGESGTRWVLGVRGVVGAVSQAGCELAGNLFRSYYHDLLWYGDSKILGSAHLEQLQNQYGKSAKECGYVSRLAELSVWQDVQSWEGERLAGTVSVPWLGEKSMEFLRQLGAGLSDISPDLGKWYLFIDTGHLPEVKKEVENLFAGLCHCSLKKPGQNYVEALLHSNTAVIYGGYNSLMDVLYTGLPTLVVAREMQDNEQQLHLQRLGAGVGERIVVVQESEVTSEQITSLLLANLSKDKKKPVTVNLEGAGRAASILKELLNF